jgi:hypothetical protein
MFVLGIQRVTSAARSGLWVGAEFVRFGDAWSAANKLLRAANIGGWGTFCNVKWIND